MQGNRGETDHKKSEMELTASGFVCDPSVEAETKETFFFKQRRQPARVFLHIMLFLKSKVQSSKKSSEEFFST